MLRAFALLFSFCVAKVGLSLATEPGEALRDTCIRGASSGFFLMVGALAPCLFFCPCGALFWKF